MKPGTRARLAAHLAVLGLVCWTASAATSLRLPVLSSAEARDIADRFEEDRRTGEFRRALAGVRRLLKSFPDRPEYLQAEAELLAQLGDPEGSAASWEAFMAVAPFPADACPHIGKAYEQAGEPSRSLDALRLCQEADPINADLAVAYAEALTEAGRTAEAEGLYRRTLKTWPGNDDGMSGLLRLRLKQGRKAEAEAMLAEFFRSGKRSTEALYISAQLAAGRGDRAAAKTLVREAIQRSPDYVELYRMLAEFQDADREWPEALKTYKALLDLAPADPRARKRVRELEGL
ncbi:MAG: tetratricopeptide repeat protein [Elusimicrobia bacterium]|nr:tetratricopeptide repeat protein [Elusimicrobiota bacterium]